MADAKNTRVTDYIPDPQNPNQHTERGVKMLEDSLAKVGLGRSIVVDKNNYILAGNSTQERAVDQGFENAIEVESDGHSLIVVKRTDLDLLNDGERARLLSLFDNRTSEVSLNWDAEQLLADVNAGMDLSALWHDWEIENMLGSLQEPFDPNKEWQGMPEFEQKRIELYHSLLVHFQTEDDLRAFAELVDQTINKTTRYIYYPKKERDSWEKYKNVNES